MTADLKLTQTGHDLTLANYDLQIVRRIDYVAQNIKQRLLSFRGEWFLDTSAGVPWLQNILKKSPRRYAVEQALKAAIQGTEGVREITAFTLSQDETRERTLRLDFTVTTVYNEQITDSLQVGV